MKKSLFEFPLQSPIPFRTGSNGEYAPPPPSRQDRLAEALFNRLSSDAAKRVGMSRREFIMSKMATATALLVINQVYGCGDGAEYAVVEDMMVDRDAAEYLSGNEFIFDVQTHHVNPKGLWRDPAVDESLLAFPYSTCGELDFVDCFDAEHYIRELFLNSQTDVAVLSQVPAVPGTSPLEHAEAAATRELVNRLSGSQRLIIHGIVLPDLGPAQLDGMEALLATHKIAAWKTYTQFGGWRLDDPNVGIPFIEKARQLGVKLICVHKGFPIFNLLREFSLPDDVGNAAAIFPDVNFLVYHSGFEAENIEGPYDPSATVGVDTLIRTILDHEIMKGPRNVYAELGSTWRVLLTRPTEAAHVIGKLLLHFGEDHVLWGTDSIWYGSPQDQIDAFRAFQIPVEMQEAYGYPALTNRVRAKILGLNAANVYGIDVTKRRGELQTDDVARARLALAEDPALRRAPLRDLGPRSRREFIRYIQAHNYRPL